MRVDVWDKHSESNAIEPVDCGYNREIDAVYDLDEQIGKGGFGRVVKCTKKACQQVLSKQACPCTTKDQQAAARCRPLPCNAHAGAQFMQVFACKIIAKRLALPNVSAERQALHIDNVKREVVVLRRLRGSLSVVQLEAAYEDDEAVYIVMERCTGGELWRPRGQHPYTEQKVWFGGTVKERSHQRWKPHRTFCRERSMVGNVSHEPACRWPATCSR